MGENESSLPFFYYEEKVRMVSYVDILAKKKISGELDIDSMIKVYKRELEQLKKIYKIKIKE